jgi:hypothetical protein
MELFLNLLWLCVSLGTLGAWGLRCSSQGSQTLSKRLAELTALSCALVFLFFAVSLTDDLHADVILFDDGAVKGHHAFVWDCCHASHQIAGRLHDPAAAAESSQPATVANLQLADRIFFITTHIARTLNQKPFYGRSPPHPVNS